MARSKACLDLQPQYTYKQKLHKKGEKNEKRKKKKKRIIKEKNIQYPAFWWIRDYTSKKTKEKETKTTWPVSPKKKQYLVSTWGPLNY